MVSAITNNSYKRLLRMLSVHLSHFSYKHILYTHFQKPKMVKLFLEHIADIHFANNWRRIVRSPLGKQFFTSYFVFIILIRLTLEHRGRSAILT